MSLKSSAFFCALLFLCSCNTSKDTPGNSGSQSDDQEYSLSDPRPDTLARALFSNLNKLSGHHVLVAHQDALAYGIGWKGEDFRTDINDVSGDHPAIFGWDLGHIGDAENIDGVPFDDMKRWAVAVHDRGGINTYSWHMRNYAMGGSSWDTDSCVEACLPGGAMHGAYLAKLDLAAQFFSSLKSADGALIPVIFRPFHEMNGGWFWWGTSSCSPEKYREIFRFTVDYLRKEKQMHQLIIVYSTDNFVSADEYMTFYPGDAWVDVMGFDDYHGLKAMEETPKTIFMLETLDSLSTAHRKLMTISETGVETIPDAAWFTGVVLPTLKTNNSTRKASWILFWRNGRPDHFYAPYAGHASGPDFIKFMNDSLMWSLSELPDMFK